MLLPCFHQVLPLALQQKNIPHLGLRPKEASHFCSKGFFPSLFMALNHSPAASVEEITIIATLVSAGVTWPLSLSVYRT